MADQTLWFIRKGDKTHGPFTSGQLKRLAHDSRIASGTRIRRGSDGPWVAARKVKGLFADPGNFTRCPNCNAKLRLPKENVAGKTLPCPKCKTTIVLKAVSSADTHPEINALSQTQPRIPSTAEASSKPSESPEVVLKGLSGKRAPLDEEPQADIKAQQYRYEEDDEDDGSAYRLSTDAIPTSTPFKFDVSDEDDWNSGDDETADDREQPLPAAEAAPDELDLQKALEGLAKQEKSQPARRRKKATKRPPATGKHR